MNQEVDQRLQCVLELPVFLHLAESFGCYVMTDELMSGWELAAARRCNIYIYISSLSVIIISREVCSGRA